MAGYQDLPCLQEVILKHMGSLETEISVGVMIPINGIALLPPVAMTRTATTTMTTTATTMVVYSR